MKVFDLFIQSALCLRKPPAGQAWLYVWRICSPVATRNPTKASCSSFLGNGKSSEFPLLVLSNVCYCFRLFLFGSPSCALSEAAAWQVSLGTSLSVDYVCVTHTNTNRLTERQLFSRTLQFIFTLIHNFQCLSESMIASRYEKRAILFQKHF